MPMSLRCSLNKQLSLGCCVQRFVYFVVGIGLKQSRFEIVNLWACTWRLTRLMCSLTLLGSSAFLPAQEPVVEQPKLPTYEATSRLPAQRLKVVGSETMSGMMNLWVSEFQRYHPAVSFEVDSKGSNNAFPALTAGQADFGLMSREPRRAEIVEFKMRFGYEPLIVPTGIDLLAVYVHRNNPVDSLSLSELDAVFSSTRRKGARRRASYWEDFTSQPGFQRKPIACFGRNAVSGTYGFFQEHVLGNGDFGPWVNQLGSSSMVAESIGNEAGAIGYSGIGFQTENVKAIGIARERNGKPVYPNANNVYNGTYPLSRFLYLIFNRPRSVVRGTSPSGKLSETQRELLRFVFSEQGQAMVAEDGFVPLAPKMIEQVVRRNGIQLQ